MRAEPRFFENRAEGLLMTPDRATDQVHPYIRGAPALARHLRQQFGAPAVRKATTRAALDEINRSGRRGVIYYHVPPGAEDECSTTNLFRTTGANLSQSLWSEQQRTHQRPILRRIIF